jgi:peptide-methionine (R)-S-oxide reductase
LPAFAAAPRPLRLSDAEWRRRLSPQAYAVLRQAATERPFSSPLNAEHRNGTFLCAGCALPLFAARTKFDSGTGWPSFWTHLPDAIATKSDTSLFMERTEVRCALRRASWPCVRRRAEAHGPALLHERRRDALRGRRSRLSLS